MPEKIKTKKIFFYTGNHYVFRAGLIGYLYEIAQLYPTVLFSEELDFETREILQDKEIFPRLEIVPVHQYAKSVKNPFVKNLYLYNLAKQMVYERKPDFVIAPNDLCPFEMYLMRFAKRIGAINIAVQPSNVADSNDTEKWIDLINSYKRVPAFLPLRLRLLLIKCRKYIGHFFYYYFLPLMVGELPFRGKSSFILYRGKSGMRDADYQIIFSESYRQMYIKEGVLAQKIFVSPHPLTRKSRYVFEKAYLNKIRENRTNEQAIVLLTPTDIEYFFKRENYSLVEKSKVEGSWIRIIKMIKEILPEWKIFIKPHPDTEDIEEVRKKFESIPENIIVTSQVEPADKYIEMADVIVGMPPSMSTALFTASLECPDKPVLSLDFNQILLGDFYENFENIKYIESEKKFIEVLNLIRNNEYRREKLPDINAGGLLEILNQLSARS